MASALQPDVAIVGGGPVGSALALALAGSELDVAIFEARKDVAISGDERTLAVSHGARLILERLAVWAATGPVTPIHAIHISQRGGFGRSLLTAEESGVPALGYVLRYAGLQRALGSALSQRGGASLVTGAHVEEIEPGPDRVCVRFSRGGAPEAAHARLLVIADGGASLGDRLGVETRVQEYGQHAVVAQVSTSRPHGFRAYERFTPDGPLALLPFEDRFALVWTAAPAAAEALSVMPDRDFLDALQRHFGDRAGRFLAVGPRGRFPLSLRYATKPVRPRTVLLGNAAQSLHPIAGQGFNLGLRDAWELADVMLRHGTPDPGVERCLSAYAAARRLDRRGGIALTDSLVRIFSNDFPPLRAMRGAALSLLDLAPAAKRGFAQRMIFGGSL